MEKAIDIEFERFWAAFKAGDADNSGVLMGEVSGIIRDAPPAAQPSWKRTALCSIIRMQQGRLC